MELIKNIDKEKTLNFANLISYEEGKVATIALARTPGSAITLFAFDKDAEISTHAAAGDALALVLEGSAEITISGKAHVVNAGEAIVMPADAPHSLKAISRFKMYLCVVLKG